MKKAILIAVALCAAACAPKGPDHLAVLKMSLVDPESATFRATRVSKERNTIWCGEVNSRNRMGGFAGFTKYIVMLPDTDYGIELENVALEGSNGFSESWNVWCR